MILLIAPGLCSGADKIRNYTPGRNSSCGGSPTSTSTQGKKEIIKHGITISASRSALVLPPGASQLAIKVYYPPGQCQILLFSVRPASYSFAPGEIRFPSSPIALLLGQSSEVVSRFWSTWVSAPTHRYQTQTVAGNIFMNSTSVLGFSFLSH